jgi:membrane protease YdiL (CAAX protease family)
MQTTAQKALSIWIRIICFLVCYISFIFLLNHFNSFITNAIFNETTSLHQFYTSVLFNFLISFLLVWFFRKVFDKESFISLGFKWKGFGKERAIGFFTAVLLITFISTILWLMQLLQWVIKDFNLQDILLITIVLILIAVTEELVFRGYLLNNLLKRMPKQAALFISAALFASFHLLNPDINLVAIINLFLAGLLLGVNYIHTKNLGFAIVFHFCWNFLQGPVLGYCVSGIELPALLFQNSKGSVLLTGGNFGLEASWLVTITLTITVMLLFILFQRKYSNISVD